MTHADLPIPGLLWGDYPERRPAPRSSGAQWNALLCGMADRSATWLRHRDTRFLKQVRAAESELAAGCLEATALQSLRLALMRQGLRAQTLVRCFATVSMAARRVLGHRPFDTQLIAARAVVQGRLAEMATGEGKTLATAIAAAAAALAGMPVHVITANDYLVARDAALLRDFYAALGLSVGAVVQADAATLRAQAYGCDIAYVTAKELVFDYLRDRVGQPKEGADVPAPLARLLRAEAAAALAPRLLRGLCMAIIDEADAILLDEACVPLILSEAADMREALDHARRAMLCARKLRPGIDYTLDGQARIACLTAQGQDGLARHAAATHEADVSPAWRNRRHREHAVCMALAALHLYTRDRHYLVRDGKVELVDETTGRVAEGRSWSNGLQQLVELKEGCAPSAMLSTVAQITYQRFFPRYHRLGGLSGTLGEARSELMETYGLWVQCVALRQPCRRRVGRARLFAHHAALWAAVTQRVAVLHRRGVPVLVATDSVEETQALAAVLGARGLPHAVLNARCERDEAQVVARAGQPGAITVTTNMAGRGTDIALGEGVAALGGLHLICCQLNGSRRVDRQLAGRSARQGDPGAVETWLSLDTTLLAGYWPAPLRAGLRRVAEALPSSVVRWLARIPQGFEEDRLRAQRERLIDHDERSARGLAFSGRRE